MRSVRIVRPVTDDRYDLIMSCMHATWLPFTALAYALSAPDTDGDVILTYRYSWEGPKPVVGKAGRTKYFVMSGFRVPYFNIEVGTEHRSTDFRKNPGSILNLRGMEDV